MPRFSHESDVVMELACSDRELQPTRSLMEDLVEKPQPDISSRVITERFRLVIPSHPDWIEPTVEYLRRRAVMSGVCTERKSGKIMMALVEAITNSIVHGNLEISSELKEQGDNLFNEVLQTRSNDPSFCQRVVIVDVDYDGVQCQWMFTDEGRGFDVPRVLARVLSDDPELLLSSGRGIMMMHSILDEVRFELEGRRTILSLKKQ